MATVKKRKAKMPKMKMGVHKSRSGGLTAKGVAAYRRANPGSKLKMAVTESKPTGKRAARRKSLLVPRLPEIQTHVSTKR